MKVKKAHRIAVVPCMEGIGLDLLDTQGRCFAHAHLDLDGASNTATGDSLIAEIQRMQAAQRAAMSVSNDIIH